MCQYTTIVCNRIFVQQPNEHTTLARNLAIYCDELAHIDTRTQHMNENVNENIFTTYKYIYIYNNTQIIHIAILYDSLYGGEGELMRGDDIL